MATDAFGRLRTSDLYTTFEYYPTKFSTQALSGIDQDLWKTDNPNSNQVDCNTTNLYIYLRCLAGGSGKITRQTKLPMLYQPGKSRLFYISSLPLSRAKTGSDSFTVRIGNMSLDTNNDPLEGFCFQTDGSVLQWALLLQRFSNNH